MRNFICWASYALTIILFSGCEPRADEELNEYCSALKESVRAGYDIYDVTVYNSFCDGEYGKNLDTISYTTHEIQFHYDFSIYAEYQNGRRDVVLDGFSGCLNVSAQFDSVIESFTVTTNHDINEEFLKQDTINQILDVRLGGNCGTDADYMDLSQYLSSSNVPVESLALKLKYNSKPDLLDSLSVSVDVLFENGESFHDSSSVSVVID